MTDHTLSFPQLDRLLHAHAEETIFHCARRSGVRIVGACGGRGTCGTCTVRVVEGTVQGAVHGPAEKEPHHRRKWLRACQAVPQSDCVVEVAPRSLAPVVRAEAEGSAVEHLPLDPLVTSRDVALVEATLEDTRSDLDRLRHALPIRTSSVDLAVARQIPGALRDGTGERSWSVRARLRKGELIGVSAPGSGSYGLGVDLGTTNAAAFLVDLDSGIRVASLGIENPQTAWGADLISRLNHAIRSPAAAEELRAAAVEAINALAHDLCRAVGAPTTDIVDVVICGNTAMHHLLLGLPVRQLGRAPFVAAVRDAMDVKAREIGLAVAPGAYVHVAANIGGFVGGDHVTALLATEELWGGRGTSLLMDIGTNTEISLIRGGAIASASCPSGPALEGGHISCGMRAAEGAIERVAVADGRIVVTVIGGKEPVGLCGSGVLDAVATLLRAGMVDARGRLAASHPDMVAIEGKRMAVLAPGVHFSQEDVRAVQLAKAAIRTGVDTLLRDAGLVETDIDRFIVAGAFGSYIDVRSAIAIGLFPDLPPDRFHQVGNAAGVGVRRMVAARGARDRARDLAAHARYVELSTRADFQKTFLRHIGFPEQDKARKPS